MDNLMMVSSANLTGAVERIGDDPHPVVLRNGAKANAAQLSKAAQLLREAEPSICNYIKAERPGWIDADQQEDDVLVFEIGILPKETYRIDRSGELIKKENDNG